MDEYYIDNNLGSDWGIIETNKFAPASGLDNKRLFVVDDFYENPDAVREFALQQYYFDDEGYLGMRTRKQFFFKGVRERFEQIIGQEITSWEDQGMNGRFQTCVAGTPLVYHCDDQRWAGMIYLTPDAPPSTGTSFFRHRRTGIRHSGHKDIMSCFSQNTFLDGTPYELVDKVGNVFNRLVIFDGRLIHAASEYFGWNIPTSRLFHMFFFS